MSFIQDLSPLLSLAQNPGHPAASATTRADGSSALSPASRRARLVLQHWDATDDYRMLAKQVMIGRALDAAADFDHADRIWPTEAPLGRGYGLFRGAAGIVHTLWVTQLDVRDLAVEWVVETSETLAREPQPEPGPFDGTAGLTWTLRQLGEHPAANALRARINEALEHRIGEIGTDLSDGLAGVGLALLAEPDASGGTSQAVERVAAELLGRQHSAPGLLHGPSGEALFWLRMFEATHDEAHLDRARTLVAADLRRGPATQEPDHSLATGIAGIGLAAAQVAAHLPGTFDSELRRIGRTLRSAETTEPGLMNGRAGLIHALNVLAQLGIEPDSNAAARTHHAQRLQQHGAPCGPGIAFGPLPEAAGAAAGGAAGAGAAARGAAAHGPAADAEQSRAWGPSFDLATGSAGILAVLQQHHDALTEHPSPTPELVPFLSPPTELLWGRPGGARRAPLE